MVSIRVLLHLVCMLMMPRVTGHVVVMMLVLHAQRVERVWRGLASGCIG